MANRDVVDRELSHNLNVMEEYTNGISDQRGIVPQRSAVKRCTESGTFTILHGSVKKKLHTRPNMNHS